MSDRSNNDRFGSLTLGEDDLARAMRLPGTPQSHEDGGKSFELNAQFQEGMRTAGVNFLVLTSHFDLADYRPERRERDPFGSAEAYVGRAAIRNMGNSSVMAYAQADVRYSDTRLTPGIQNLVHRNSGLGGRDVRPEYAASRVPNDLNAGVSGMAEYRRENMRMGGLEFKPSVFAAGALGTDAVEAAVGARAVIGRGVDGTPRPIPTANPEAPGAMFVRNPNEFQGGNWSVGTSITQYAIGHNRYLRAGEPERADPRRLALEAAYNISHNVSLTASYENYDNPVARLPRLSNEQGPGRQGTFKGGLTFRF